MRQLTLFLIGIMLFACKQEASIQEQESEYLLALEIYGISYYDHEETFNPSIALEFSSEPHLLGLNEKDTIAFAYETAEQTVNHSDGTPPTQQRVGALIFKERVNGKWEDIGGGEPLFDLIQLDQWRSAEMYMNDCDSGEPYFSLDYRFKVTRSNPTGQVARVSF